MIVRDFFNNLPDASIIKVFQNLSTARFIRTKRRLYKNGLLLSFWHRYCLYYIRFGFKLAVCK